MPSLVWCLVLVSILSAGWMVFDGLHALILGDYVTPRSGPDAGRLGPWARIVSAIGIEPRCTAMKLAFVLEGTITLAFLLAFALGAGWAWWGLLAASVLGLWYAPVGTVLSLLAIVLLLLPAVRGFAGVG